MVWALQIITKNNNILSNSINIDVFKRRINNKLTTLFEVNYIEVENQYSSKEVRKTLPLEKALKYINKVCEVKEVYCPPLTSSEEERYGNVIGALRKGVKGAR